MPEVKTAVGSALLKLGDGNWKMGEGITVPKTARLGEGDEDLILENFICRFTPLILIPPVFTTADFSVVGFH